MAQPRRRKKWPEQSTQQPSAQWHELRDELEDLLEQISDHRDEDGAAHAPDAYGQTSYTKDPYSQNSYAERRVDTPMSNPNVSARHSHALRNVQAAVDRFSDYEETSPMPAHTRQGLHDAIEQIRSGRRSNRRPSQPSQQGFDRHTTQQNWDGDRQNWGGDRPARNFSPVRSEAPREDAQLADLSASVADIANRLHRFDDILSAENLPSQHLGEVAVQIEQLTSIVEVLAGKVNERGAFDAIEQQVAALAGAMDANANIDISAVENRLDGITQAFDQLTALQAEHHTQLRVDQADRFGKEDAERHYSTIEDGVRNIYERLDTLGSSDLQASISSVFDRIDQLEKTISHPEPMLERLTHDVAELNQAIRANKGPVVASVIGTRIDALNDRITDIENTGTAKAPPLDLGALKNTLDESLNQKFSELDTKIGGIANGLKSRSVKLESSPQLEAQIKTLTEKLEKTSADLEELRGREPLTPLGAADPNGLQDALPDFEAIADLIATRTGSELAKANSSASKTTSHLLNTFEGKISQLISSASAVEPSADLSGIERGINSVNARLAQLESALNSESGAKRNAQSQPFKAAPAQPVEDDHTIGENRDQKASPTVAASQDSAAQFAAANKDRPRHPGLQDGAEDGMSMSHSRNHLVPEARDTMPRAPADEAPLNAPAFPPPSPQGSATDAPASSERKISQSVPVPNALREEVDKLINAADEKVSPAGEAKKAAPLPKFNHQDVAPPPPPASSFADDAENARAQGDHRAEAGSFASQNRDDLKARAEAINDQGDGDTPWRKKSGSFSKEAEIDDNSVSRSTFIAAARRAAQANNPSLDESNSNSVIGRALSRFQRKKSEKSEKSALADNVDFEQAKPNAENFERDQAEPFGLNGADPEVDAAADAEKDAKPRLGRFWARKKQNEDSAKTEKRKKSENHPVPTPVIEDDVAFVDEDDDLDIVQQSESFLSRNSRPILLALTVVAVGLMTLNLVSQRMGNAQTANLEVASDATQAAIGSQSVDGTAVGSIPAMDSEGENSDDTIRVIDPSENLTMPPSLEPASLSAAGEPGLMLAPPSGIVSAAARPTLAMPGEEVGPLGLREAAMSGDPRAMFEVGAIISEGRAVPQDMPLAAKWYEQSALQGYAPASYFLANMLENGTGIDQNAAQAIYWYEKGAAAGNRMSMHNLAAMHASGATGEQDFSQAAFWFERAAALGLTDSQFNLGMLHARGLGVPQDLQKSFVWFSIAAEGGDADAVKARDDVARSLTPETVARIQADIADWTAQSLDIKANFAPIGTWDPDFDPGEKIDNNDVVQRVQTALTRLGYDVGIPDGLMGPKTTEAIKSFERATGMNEVGAVNPRLLAVLGSQPV